MNRFYQIILLLLFLGVAACTSTRPDVTVAGSDEDLDVGLGGTGMLADTGNGLGGTGMNATGIVGKITGFGSIFVNGVEIEYDQKTAFSIDGRAVGLQVLEIGDVVEVLTSDDQQHTRAQAINLRHEVVGKVESIEPQTFSFTVSGQSIVQPINKVILPAVGDNVAVSGFRIDAQTVLATRVTTADAGQVLVRTATELPFKGKTGRWIVQTHVKDSTATFALDGKKHAVKLKQRTENTISERLGIKVLQLLEPAPGQLQLEREIDATTLPRGRQTAAPDEQRGNNSLPGSAPGSSPGAVPGSLQRSIQDALPGAGSSTRPGSIQNLKR